MITALLLILCLHQLKFHHKFFYLKNKRYLLFITRNCTARRAIYGCILGNSKKPVGLTVHSNAAGLAPSHSQILQCAAVCVCLPLRPLARYYTHSGAGGYNSHLHFYYECIKDRTPKSSFQFSMVHYQQQFKVQVCQWNINYKSSFI